MKHPILNFIPYGPCHPVYMSLALRNNWKLEREVGARAPVPHSWRRNWITETVQQSIANPNPFHLVRSSRVSKDFVNITHVYSSVPCLVVNKELTPPLKIGLGSFGVQVHF